MVLGDTRSPLHDAGQLTCCASCHQNRGIPGGSVQHARGSPPTRVSSDSAFTTCRVGGEPRVRKRRAAASGTWGPGYTIGSRPVRGDVALEFCPVACGLRRPPEHEAEAELPHTHIPALLRTSVPSHAGASHGPALSLGRLASPEPSGSCTRVPPPGPGSLFCAATNLLGSLSSAPLG